LLHVVLFCELNLRRTREKLKVLLPEFSTKMGCNEVGKNKKGERSTLKTRRQGRRVTNLLYFKLLTEEVDPSDEG
jgi:hypothetical protein